MVLTLIAVFAAFRFALYIPETISLITVPYSEITVTLAWVLIALVGVWVLGQTVQTTASPLISAIRKRFS